MITQRWENQGLAYTEEAFATLLEQHIRFEERTYFPEVEKILTEKQLRQIGEHLQNDDHTNCMNYPVKFWE